MLLLLFLKRVVKYFLFHVKWHRRLSFYFTSDISLKSTFEGANKVYPYSYYKGSMGYGTYIGPHCEIKANIGRFTSISPFVRTNTGIHPMSSPYMTTSPMFYSTQKQNGKTFADRMLFNEFKKSTTIGNDVWVGENVFFTGGLTIGDGAVVLAGAVVTKDVPPYAVVGGVPAGIIKFRYDKDTIDWLLNLRWWDMDVEWLEEHWELFCDMEKFKSYTSSNNDMIETSFRSELLGWSGG